MVFVLYLMIRSRDGNRTCPEYQILTTKIELDFTIEVSQTAQLITTVMLVACSGGMMICQGDSVTNIIITICYIVYTV